METLTKTQKIESLKNAMTRSKRPDETEYTHFTDDAPESLQSLFLEHYEVRDVDYMTFSEACDIMSELYQEASEKKSGVEPDDFEDAIYERASDCASVYTSDRLDYLNIWNQDEVADIMREYSAEDIATACAIWYDRQTEQACFIIKQWIDSNEG